MPSARIVDLLGADLVENVGIFIGGRERVDYEELSNDERKAVLKCFREGLQHLEKVSPVIAADIRRQEELAVKAAMIAKGVFPESKPIAFPSETGTIGVAWLFPGAIRYVASPSSDNPAYSSYKLNKWEIDLTEGTPAYFFGDGTNYYRACSQAGKHELILVFKNGVIEFGSTPKIDTFRMYTRASQRYGVFTVEPLIEVQVEVNKAIYQYPTPLGATIIYHDFDFMWGFMPRYSGTAVIKLLGLVFYEHDLFPDLASTWIS